MNLEDDRERSQTAAGLWLCRFPRCVCSSADALQQQLRGEAPPPYELGGDPNFELVECAKGLGDVLIFF